MSWNGSGTVEPPGAPEFPAVSGDLIRAAYFNQVVQEIIDNFLNCLPRDGQAPATGNINLNNSYRIVSMPAAIANGQAVRYEEFRALETDVAGLASQLEPFVMYNLGVI